MNMEYSEKMYLVPQNQLEMLKSEPLARTFNRS